MMKKVRKVEGKPNFMKTDTGWVGKFVKYSVGDIILEDTETGERKTALYGTSDAEGNFLRYCAVECRSFGNCSLNPNERAEVEQMKGKICRRDAEHDLSYRERNGYYVEI